MKTQITETTSQVMTHKLLTVSYSDSIRKAHQIMQDRRIRHLPVMDDRGAIIGILSDRDIQRAMTPQASVPTMEDKETVEFDPKFEAKDFMSWPVAQVTETCPLDQVVDRLLQERISALVVVNHDSVPLGILTTDDLMRLLREYLAKDPRSVSKTINSLWVDFKLHDSECL